MEKSLKYLAKLIAITSVPLFHGCGGSDSGIGSSPNNSQSGAGYSLSGQVQKGPLIFGSRIWVAELDANLNPNGKTYLAQTKDDLGNFTISSTIGSSVVELLGMGYYLDEITGSLSVSPITLSAIADLSVDNSPTINILTTLQAPRIKNLILQGKTYSEANIQSQREVLQVFGIDSAKINLFQSLYAMSLNGNSDQDSALLAATAVLSRMSTTAALANGSSQAAEMSYFLSRIASELASSGLVTTASVTSAIRNASSTIDLAAVRTNIETYYANKGVTLVAPKFEEWVDKDNSGILPKRKISSTIQSFVNNTNQNPSEVVTSNGVTISGVGSNSVYIELSGSNGNVSLLKNGSIVSGAFTNAVEGDEFKIRATTPSWGGSASYTLIAGSQSLSYTLSTRPLIVTFYQGINSSSGCQSQGGAGSDFKYFAIPFRTTTNDFLANSSVTSRYIATGVMQGGPTSGPLVPSRIEIQADNNGEPAGVALSTAVIGNYSLEGTGSLAYDRSNNNFDTRGTIPTQGFFGTSGYAFQANTTYWAVHVYSSATRPDTARCGPSEPTAYGRTKISSDGSSWTNAGVGYLPRVVLYD
jgi:hypothetical protein